MLLVNDCPAEMFPTIVPGYVLSSVVGWLVVGLRDGWLVVGSSDGTAEGREVGVVLGTALG